MPDTYAALASNITKTCGSVKGLGVDWDPAHPLTGGVNKTTHTEYHICGDLKLSGIGYLTGMAPVTDSVIIIENGDLIIDDDASINTMRTAIVMTGTNSYSARVKFPNGAGKLGTLTLSPPTNSTNPWQAVALYLDPVLTSNVNNTWGSGAQFNADGLVYLGNSNVVTDGNTSSTNSKCTKFVMNSFTTNGHVDLTFTQSDCASIGLKQWGGIIVHLTR